jgi:glycerol kinase
VDRVDPVRGALHVTDHTNAAVTGLYSRRAGWNERTCEALGVPTAMLPPIVDTAGSSGGRPPSPGAPPIAALVGDQQASLVGQGCIEPGMAKITFGTGGMLDVCTGDGAPTRRRGAAANGTFPIVAWSHRRRAHLGHRGDHAVGGQQRRVAPRRPRPDRHPAESHDVAASVRLADGVVYVPALLGLGTPQWDYGARGTLLGLTRGTGRAHVVRAVLEGVAHRGADLVDAAEAETGLSIPALARRRRHEPNPTFVQALADATGKTVEVSPIVEATTLGRRLPRRHRRGRVARPDVGVRVVGAGSRRRSGTRCRPRCGTSHVAPRRRACRTLDPRAVRPRLLTPAGFGSNRHATPRLASPRARTPSWWSAHGSRTLRKDIHP